ncbi:MAG: amino acid adenylation domain-containing protein [Chloroflexota bacterium]
MDTRNVEDIYPLSPMQQGMLFHTLYAPESSVYFEQSGWTLRGDLDVSAFRQAWQQVLDHHPALRTAFVWEGLDEPLQVVHRRLALPFEVLDWRELPQAEQQVRFEAFLQTDRERAFELAAAPLMRLTLIRVADGAYRFVWSHHHLLFDGWSQPIIFQGVFLAYEAFRRGQKLLLPPERPYRDYIAWLQRQDAAQMEAFWRHYLDAFAAPTPLTVDGDYSAAADGVDYAVLRAMLPAETAEALRFLGRQHGLTLNTLMQGVWALLLNRYSGESDVLFGATVAGRPAELPGAETMVGLFINTLPVRAQVSPRATSLDWLRDLQAQQATLRQYEYAPLFEIQGWSQVPRDLPLFESLLVFENYPMDQTAGRQQASVEIAPDRSFTRTNYPLTLAVSPGREIGLELAYEMRRFDAATVERMLGHLQTLLAGIAADPQQPIGSLPLLTEAERQRIVVDWNDTQADFPDGVCAHRLFEAQVARQPEAIALSFEGQALTYGELNARANQLAHYMSKLGVGPETIVGLCVERSPEMVVGLLGVMKAGGAYLPLDPDYPEERLAYMLTDSQAGLLLTQTHLQERVGEWANLQSTPHTSRLTICLDAEWPLIAQEPQTNPAAGVTAENLAYVIYTSGSTGRPKGALLHHRGLCNFVHACIQHFAIAPGSRVLQFAAFGFDASVAEIFLALLSGARLHLARRDTLVSIPTLVQLLRDQRITVAILPPSLLSTLPAEGLSDLQTLVSAGEACTPEIVERWSPGRRFFNGYGPTEATIGPALARLESLPEGAVHVPIGRPVANMRIYLLDAHLRPVPVGVPGELHIGGVGVGRGYLNRPDLTAERFIADPFSFPASGGGREGVARLYKTGDLARYRADGTIEFLGRMDHQVKVRGFRIELGEIEAVLSAHPAVQQAAVLAREDDGGGKQLAAYVVLRQPEPSTGELREYLRASLPDYMLPAVFVTLDEMPLTPSGKVDRRALPAPQSVHLTRMAYVAPRTPVEEGLADIFAQVVSLDRVGVHDSFFDLGGHSLRATQVISRVREVFQIDLPLRALFEWPTVAGLAVQVEAALRTGSGLEAPPIEAISREGDTPLSFAQQRLWFLDQLEPGNLFYNIPIAMRLQGKLDVAALERVLSEIVRRHEALRTTFAVIDGRPVQVIAPEPAVSLPLKDLTSLPQAEREAETQRLAILEVRQPFDLARGPLLRARLIRLGEQEHVALLTMHHIVSDGWSMGVLVAEIAQLYAAFAAGQPSPLPELAVQYADFSHWQRAWLQGEVLERQLVYWKQRLINSPPMLELPTDRPRPAVQTSHGATLSFDLPGELSQALKELGREEGVTLFMTLLAAFQTLLYRYTGQPDVVVGTPIANRTRREVEGLIGFFVNTLVMRTDLSGAPSFRQLLARVREVALGAYAHQDLPFELLVEALQPGRDLSHTPLFQVMLVLDTPPAGPLTLPGLTLNPIDTHSGAATFDLTLSVTDGPEGLGGYFEYNTDLFDRSTIERLAGHLNTLLQGIVAEPDRSVTLLPLLTAAEQQQSLVAWNDTQIDFPDTLCAHQLFEAQVARQPDAVALTFEGQSLTYAGLNARANQLAHYLTRMEVRQGTLVGICAERSPEMIVGILGILKAGGAYLPLDPTYPQERLVFMLEDSGAPVLLTQSHLQERIGEWANQHMTPHASRLTICLDADWPMVAHEPQTNPESGVTPEDVAYIIYTSGSTGKPKGTLLRHRGLVNLAAWQKKCFDIEPGSKVLQFSPFSFDASVWETFMALANGATLCLARQEVLASGPDLVTLLRQEGVTNVTLPPSVLRVLPVEDLPSLRTVIAAGEACTPDLVQRWAPGRDFFNAYGPTETTVCASIYLCDERESAAPPIGRPIANTRLYILDAHLQPVAVGVPAELHVGGVSLAKGYLHRLELTEARFVPDPFSDDPHARLYKTGDLVRYRADGNIEFLGRIDHQVKVRGFRIELGEIEAVLKQHPAVQDGAVVAREDVPGGRRLVAYAVPADGVELATGELRNFLRQALPEYMVPATFVFLEALPLSPSGKVDRRALPAPEGVRPDLEREYVPPRTDAEHKLAGICAELLGVDRVGVYDNFFELGGHSLLATQFMSRVRQEFQIEVPLRSLFERPTVAELAQEIIESQAIGPGLQAPAIVPVARHNRRVSRSLLDRNDGAGPAGL